MHAATATDIMESTMRGVLWNTTSRRARSRTSPPHSTRNSNTNRTAPIQGARASQLAECEALVAPDVACASDVFICEKREADDPDAPEAGRIANFTGQTDFVEKAAASPAAA